MKIKVNQTLVAVLTSAVLFTSTAANASGIPTVDGAAIAQGVQNMVMDMANQAEQMAEWVKQYENMLTQIENLQAQLEQQKAHYEAITKARGVGKVDAVLDAINNAPDEWADIYATVQKIDPTATLKDIKIDPDKEVKNAEYLKQKAVKDINQISAVLEDLTNIYKTVKNGEVKDQKDAADLANRIMLNTARVTTIAAQYDIMQKQFEQEQRLQEQKQHELDRCGFREERGLKCD